MYYSGAVKVKSLEFDGKESTGHEMYKMASEYWADLGSFLSWPFSAWFDYVRLIPYQSDTTRFPGRVIELVPRPSYLLDRTLFPKIDCKKKAILVGAWARGNNLPFRFLAVSMREDEFIHHVFPQIDFGRGWITADATFPGFEIGQGFELTRAEELGR